MNTYTEEINRKRLEKERLTDKEVNLLYDIIDITHKILTENNIRYTIEGGTLLGAVRNGGLIPHDNDGDFDILESDVTNILKLKDEFAKYDLVIIPTPGWGLQISHKDSPDLAPNMWTDIINGSSWTSKFPFLDLIIIKFDQNTNKYISAGDVCYNDYPNYYLTKEEWETDFETIKFGHLDLFVIAGNVNRINYLDRNYKNWNTQIEMVMDHRENVYFDDPIRCNLTDSDRKCRIKNESV